jgi:peptidoglycan hydrolase CwlO-like protein
MSQSITQKLEKFLGSNIAKTLVSVVVIIFTAGVVYEKISYSIENMPKEIAEELIKQITDAEKKIDAVDKKVDEHVLVDHVQKEGIKDALFELKQRLKDVENRQSGYANREFVRPSGVEIPEPEENKKRR